MVESISLTVGLVYDVVVASSSDAVDVADPRIYELTGQLVSTRMEVMSSSPKLQGLEEVYN